MKKGVFIMIFLIILLLVAIGILVVKIYGIRDNNGKGPKFTDLIGPSLPEIEQTLVENTRDVSYYNFTGTFHMSMKGNFSGNNVELISNGSLSGYVDREKQEYYLKQEAVSISEGNKSMSRLEHTVKSGVLYMKRYDYESGETYELGPENVSFEQFDTLKNLTGSIDDYELSKDFSYYILKSKPDTKELVSNMNFTESSDKSEQIFYINKKIILIERVKIYIGLEEDGRSFIIDGYYDFVYP